MKINKEYILRQIADMYVVLPVGYATAKFNGMLTLNETAVKLWQLLEQGATYEMLEEKLISEYSISAQDAKKDVDDFIKSLSEIGCLE